MKFKVPRDEITEIKIFKSFSDMKTFPLKADKYLIVSDSICIKKFAREISDLKRKLKAPCFTISLPSNQKDFSIINKIFDFMISKKFSRESAIIAFGGGTISDLSGLSAALYMRGIKFSVIPTTFLAQIDAGFGGKTAADFKGYRNILGAFKQPDLVLCFADLPDAKEIRKARGELIKYFFLSPKSFPKDKKGLLERLEKDIKIREKCIRICSKLKMDTVLLDPLDKGGKEREKLNLGHSAAHAFEYALKGKISHGEAVRLGLEFEFILSLFLKKLKESFISKAKLYFFISKPDINLDKIKFKTFQKALFMDKKNRGKKNKFFVFSPDGGIMPAREVKIELLKKAFERIKNEYTRDKWTKSQSARRKK